MASLVLFLVAASYYFMVHIPTWEDDKKIEARREELRRERIAYNKAVRKFLDEEIKTRCAEKDISTLPDSSHAISRGK